MFTQTWVIGTEHQVWKHEDIDDNHEKEIAKGIREDSKEYCDWRGSLFLCLLVQICFKFEEGSKTRHFKNWFEALWGFVLFILIRVKRSFLAKIPELVEDYSDFVQLTVKVRHLINAYNRKKMLCMNGNLIIDFPRRFYSRRKWLGERKKKI